MCESCPIMVDHNRLDHRQTWREYLSNRRGTYEYRTLRYSAVYGRLEALGLEPTDLIIDVGAGMCDFDRYLRQTQNFTGQYLPVDGAIDGTDLNVWSPSITAEFFVSLETLEHLSDPLPLLETLPEWATKGVVITTPNPKVVDVLAIDPTHVSPMKAVELQALGYAVEYGSLFGQLNDSLLAYRKGTLSGVS